MPMPLPISDRDHVQGLPDAPVTLLEYGDYECPYCGLAHPIVKRVQRALGRNLRFAFRNFPLVEAHPHALAAAQTAEAAAFQKAFWPMHDRLFGHQDALDEPDLLTYAQELDLDLARFLRDARGRMVHQRIAVDVESGVRAGVEGTPVFFINGEMHRGPWDYEHLFQALLEHLPDDRGTVAP
jgi:formate-nitrite transporter family protein